MSMTITSSTKGGTEGLRNRFFARKRMLAEDFKIEQDYFINAQRRINRAVLGWGIIQGFEIEGAMPPGPCGCGADRGSDTAAPSNPAVQASSDASSGASSQEVQQAVRPQTTERTYGNRGVDDPQPVPFPLEVRPGFALDEGGRSVVLRSGVTLTPENTMLLVRKGNGWIARDIDGTMERGEYVLAVHYAEFKAGATISPSLCCCGEPERTHLREGVIFSLRKDDCRCGEPAIPLDGLCVDDGCGSSSRGPHARLADWALRRQDEAGDVLCAWHDIEIARGEGVDLACVVVDDEPVKCKPILISGVDGSTPRRVVKTTDTLYDLLNGRDLTRIEEISWAEWHRRSDKLPWETFAGFFTSDPSPAGDLLTKFAVRFSGLVKADSIRRDTVAMTVHMADGGTGWIRSRRLPLRDPDVTPSSGTLPSGTTDQFTVTVDKRWYRDEIKTEGESYLSERNFMVEIEIHGDLIEDCSGQAVDANAVGLRPAPTGNGTPGGTYLSTFTVRRMTRPEGSSD